jgi:hypothetical protein
MSTAVIIVIALVVICMCVASGDDGMPKCPICRDNKSVEVLTMGYDTEWIDCPGCQQHEL